MHLGVVILWVVACWLGDGCGGVILYFGFVGQFWASRLSVDLVRWCFGCVIGWQLVLVVVCYAVCGCCGFGGILGFLGCLVVYYCLMV